MEVISYTAQWTAAIRAAEAERADPLFVDPYAKDLAAPRGFELLDRYSGGGVADFVTIRTWYVDQAIRKVLADGRIRQVVLVAGGMDTRTHRLDWPAGTVVYEMDHDALLAEKRARLDRLGAVPKVRTVAVGADLTEDWRPALVSAGFTESEPALWVAEGLVFFLTEEQAGTMLAGLAGASAPGSRLCVDMTSATLLRHPITQSFLTRLREDGTPWQFGTDDPAAFLARHGWTVRDLSQPGEPGAGAGRWPYAVAPMGVPAPRSWLVEAALSVKEFG